MAGHASSWIVAAAIAGVMIFGGILWLSGPTDAPKEAAAPPLAAPSNVRASATTPAPLPFASPTSDEQPGGINTPALTAATDEETLVASLTELVRSDPAAAARTIETMPGGELRVAAMRTVFREWAAIAPGDALAWIASMNSEEDRVAAREFVHYRIAEDDPKSALDSARELGADLSMPIVHDLAQQWASRNTIAARDWALSLPTGPDRDRILSRVAFVLSQQDPEAAGNIVAAEIPPGPEQDEAAMSVLHQWAMRDLDAATEWVAQFPEGPLRTRAEQEIEGIRQYLPASRD